MVAKGRLIASLIYYPDRRTELKGDAILILPVHEGKHNFARAYRASHGVYQMTYSEHIARLVPPTVLSH